MSTDSEMLKERQKLRYQVLKVMYDRTVGRGKDTRGYFYAYQIAEHLGLPPEKVSPELRYLDEELLVSSAGPEMGIPQNGEQYRLTHEGIVEIEHSVEFPEQRTQHFMLSVVQHFHGTVGSVQNAPDSVANVEQHQKDSEQR